MPLRMHAFRSVCATLLFLAAVSGTLGQSEPRVISGEVNESGIRRIKIAIPDVEGPRAGSQDAVDIARTVRDDLTYSGYFDVVDPTLYDLVKAVGPNATIRHDDWLSIGADTLVELRLGSGERIDLEARLHDNTGKTLLLGQRYGGSRDNLVRVAHRVASDLVQAFTGNPGVAMTRIAFVSKHGDGKEIYLMDYDGRRVRRLTTSGTINLSPAWSPDGEELTFVSWRGRQPGVYVMSNEGALGSLKTVGGELSTAPDWSPDGRKLAYTSDIDGNTEIYVLDRDRGRNTRLTRHAAIDTAPAFSPNGREIAFTSDRSGTPQIYLMDSEGLNVRRISWEGSYNESPAWDPTGERLAYVSRQDGLFQIVVLDLATDRLKRLTRSEGDNENPRWSPDGRHLVFSSNRGGSYDIYTMHADGTGVRRLTKGGDAFTPDWSR